MKGWGLGLVLGAALAVPGVALHAGFNSGFDVRLAGGGNDNSGADLETDFDIPVGSSFAPYAELGVDYGNEQGFVVGLDLLNGPNRSHSYSVPGDSGTIDVSSFGCFVTPGWRFCLLPHLDLEARLGLGLLDSTMDLKSDFYGTQTSHGLGWGVWPELRGEYELGSWGLGVSLGYLASLVSSLEDSNGQVVQDWQYGYATLHTEGFSTGLFVVYHFTPLFQ